jgi:transposase
VDLEAKVLIEMVQGNGAVDLHRWITGADPRWIAGIDVVATDLAESFRAGLSPELDHATRVADPFHVVRVGNRCLDKVRRRVQNETLGHRRRKGDPLYRIRKLLLAGAERLDERGEGRMLLGLRIGDPHDEVLGAWLAGVGARRVPHRRSPSGGNAARQGHRRLRGRRRRGDPVPRQHARIMAKRDPRPPPHRGIERSHGGLNLCVKRVKRCGHGFKRFEHYRLRVLLHAGGVTWPSRPRPPRIRTRPPHSNA